MDLPGLYKFRNQAVRDLAWVVGSPPLLNNSPKISSVNFIKTDFFNNQLLKFSEYLKDLDKNPSKLNDFLSVNNTRLIGKYFEKLVEFWLLGRKDIKLIGSNIQIINMNKTLGEFDFIYKDLVTNRIIHLEVAGKFYLAEKNNSEWSNFIGPNGIDNLKSKLEKMQNDQIPLSKNDIAKRALSKLGITTGLISKVILKGYLFYHLKYFEKDNFAVPYYAEPSHLKGWWLRENEIELLENFLGKQWIVVPRKNWVSRVYNCNTEKLLDRKTLLFELKKYFLTNRYPLLIAELSRNSSGCLLEKSRGFVVSNTWPNDERKNS